MSRRLLLFSDAHLDTVTAGVHRFSEIAAVCEGVVQEAVAREIDCVLFLGDWCDPDSVCSHAATAVGVKVALALARGGIASRWLTGNHDVVEDGVGSSVLAPLAPLCNAGLPKREGSQWPGPLVVVYDRPSLDFVSSDLLLVSLPYTARSHGGVYDPESFVRDVVRPQARATDAAHVMVVSHLMLEGIGPGSETTTMARGRDVFLPVRALREAAPHRLTIFNGHYHAPQTFSVDGVPVHVVGSLVRCRFDEAHNATGYVLFEI